MSPAVFALTLLVAGCGDSAQTTGTGAVPPSVFITQPEDRSMVRTASFDVTGGFGGSVVTIEVYLDSRLLGPARRGDESGTWRLPASEFSLSRGLHRFSVTATGEGGSDSASKWVFFDPESPFEIAISPTEASYAPGEFDTDPDLLLLGDDVPLDLSVQAPPGISAGVNPRLDTGSLAKVMIDVRSEVPGAYPVVVRARGPDGTVREATHTITIVGTEPTTSTTVPISNTTATTTGPPSGAAGVLFDDFEGPDLWTATVTNSTNGSEATAELATGGNPGSFRSMIHRLPGTSNGENNPTQISVVHMFTGGGWDPATEGALSHIDYSEDQIELAPPFEGAAIGARFVIQQDGIAYLASINENNAYRNTDWQTTRVDGLTPGHFSPAPGPDFSATGGALTFGFMRSNTSRSSGGIITTHGIDNWTVEFFTE